MEKIKRLLDMMGAFVMDLSKRRFTGTVVIRIVFNEGGPRDWYKHIEERGNELK